MVAYGVPRLTRCKCSAMYTAIISHAWRAEWLPTLSNLTPGLYGPRERGLALMQRIEITESNLAVLSGGVDYDWRQDCISFKPASVQNFIDYAMSSGIITPDEINPAWLELAESQNSVDREV